MNEERKENYYFKKQRVGLVLVGVFSSVLMVAVTSLGISGMIAQIQNSVNTAATGILTMKETNATGDVVCESTESASNSATCASINKYGGTATPLIPGGAGNTTTIKISNTGNIPATQFSVKGGVCSVEAASGASFSGNGLASLCEKINVVIKNGANVVFSGTAKAFQDGAVIDILSKISKGSVNPGEEIAFDITVSLDQSADASHQGLEISQPITWQFGA